MISIDRNAHFLNLLKAKDLQYISFTVLRGGLFRKGHTLGEKTDHGWDVCPLLGYGLRLKAKAAALPSTHFACCTQLPGKHLMACDFGITTQMRTANQQSDLTNLSSFDEVKIVVGLYLSTISWALYAHEVSHLLIEKLESVTHAPIPSAKADQAASPLASYENRRRTFF